MKLRTIQAATRYTAKTHIHLLAGQGTCQRVLLVCHNYDDENIYVYGCISDVYYVDQDMHFQEAQGIKQMLLSRGWQEVADFDLAQTMEAIRHGLL